MAEYIKRDEAIAAIKWNCWDERTPIEAVNSVPSADVVEVVRCKTCKKFKTYKCPMCNLCSYDDFCSFGERKDGA